MTINDEDATLASDGCRLLTIDAAADFLAISRGAVYHLLDRGEVASIHNGRSRRIALAELRRFVAKASVKRNDSLAGAVGGADDEVIGLMVRARECVEVDAASPDGGRCR